MDAVAMKIDGTARATKTKTTIKKRATAKSTTTTSKGGRGGRKMDAVAEKIDGTARATKTKTMVALPYGRVVPSSDRNNSTIIE